MKNEPTGTEAKVCDLIAQRQRLGVTKYGTTVAANPLSLRQWLQHGLEEALDLAVYLQRSIEELDASGAGGQVAQASSGAGPSGVGGGVVQGSSGEGPSGFEWGSGMTVDDLRAERKELDSRIFSLCQTFQKRTGLCVVALGAETQTVHALNREGAQTFLIGVRAEVQSI